MAGRELARLLPAIDTDHDGAISTDELTAGHDAVARAFAGGLTVSADAKTCPGTLDRAWALEAEGGVVFQVRYVCPEVPDRLTLAMPMLDALAPGHRHLARLFRAGKAQVKVLDRAHATWELAGASSTSSQGSPWPGRC